MLIALTQGIIAQQELTFTSLDWNEMKIDSVECRAFARRNDEARG